MESGLKTTTFPFTFNLSLMWRIIDKGKAYSPSSKLYNICLQEKYYIICKTELASLNDSNEPVSG